MNDGEFGERVKGKKPKKVLASMTLQKAVDMGEYEPVFLSTFPEWQTMSRHLQFQFIKTGLENRRHQLLQQYAQVSNVLDFRLKPELKKTLANIHKQLKYLDDRFEELTEEYFK